MQQLAALLKQAGVNKQTLCKWTLFKKIVVKTKSVSGDPVSHSPVLVWQCLILHINGSVWFASYLLEELISMK